MMVFYKNSAGGNFSAASKLLYGPYDTTEPLEQTELSIPVTAPGTVIVSLLSPFSRTFSILRNSSPAAQLIRFCPAPAIPSFTPATGQLLKPNEVVSIENVSLPIVAIADVAGALVSRFIVRSSGPPII